MGIHIRECSFSPPLGGGQKKLTPFERKSPRVTIDQRGGSNIFGHVTRGGAKNSYPSWGGVKNLFAHPREIPPPPTVVKKWSYDNLFQSTCTKNTAQIPSVIRKWSSFNNRAGVVDLGDPSWGDQKNFTPFEWNCLCITIDQRGARVQTNADPGAIGPWFPVRAWWFSSDFH